MFWYCLKDPVARASFSFAKIVKLIAYMGFAKGMHFKLSESEHASSPARSKYSKVAGFYKTLTLHSLQVRKKS